MLPLSSCSPSVMKAAVFCFHLAPGKNGLADWKRGITIRITKIGSAERQDKTPHDNFEKRFLLKQKVNVMKMPSRLLWVRTTNKKTVFFWLYFLLFVVALILFFDFVIRLLIQWLGIWYKILFCYLCLQAAISVVGERRVSQFLYIRKLNFAMNVHLSFFVFINGTYHMMYVGERILSI